MGAYAGPDVSESGLVLALDAANKKSYSQNEFQYSTDIYSWATSAQRATLSRDTISSPVGNTPLKMEVTGNDPFIESYNSAIWNIAPALNGETWIVSVYVKADVATTGQIFIFGANSSGAAYVNGGWLSLTNVGVNIGTEWTRVHHVHTMNNADVAYIHMRLDGPNSGGTGQNIWWDGLQVERVPSGTTTPTPFTSYYYGGSVYKDLVGSNNGTLVNRLTYSSVNGGSLSFDGVNDHVSFSSASELQFLNRLPYTLEVWMYPTANPGASTWTGIFNREDSSVGSRDGYNIYLNGSASSTFYLTTERFCTGTGTQVVYTYNDSDLLNIWHHVVATYDGTTLRLYRNGEQLNSATSTGNITNTSKTLEIGRRGGGSYFNGRLTGQKIYNKSLTASEIKQNFVALRGRFGI